MKRTSGNFSDSTNPRKKRAVWSKQDTNALIQMINDGESVAEVVKEFDGAYTQAQVHSKVSNLKKQGVIKKIPSSGIAPSLQKGTFQSSFESILFY